MEHDEHHDDGDAAAPGHQHRGDTDEHGHGHGHEHDRGVRAMFRYLRFAPQMWTSDVNDAVVDMVAPAPGERVVDIGAGMGPGTVRAAKAGAEVVAVEPTPYMRGILTARRWSQRARARITVADAGAEDLPVADGSVDAVWAVNTMHHWVDLERGTAEIARVLRPGGRVLLVDEDFDDPTHPDFERFGSVRGDDHDHLFETVDTERIGSLLERAGLVAVEAGPRRLADRPVLAVTARAAG